MDNKYYTPSIEEFYVGFEYEIRQVDTWFKETMQSNECLCDFVNTEGYRVKYLDKEDIESLGWEDWRDMGMSCFRYNLKDPDDEFQLYYQFDNQYCQIYNWNAEFIFKGTIKNKSELKVLMKQLGIYE